MRGKGNDPTRNKLKRLVKNHNVDIVAIVEPIIDIFNIGSLKILIDMLGYLSNCNVDGKV